MLELREIVKDYYVEKEPIRALNGISLYWPKNQFCSILGPSGCGKTTTLNIIGGLDKYTSGDLVIEGISTKNYSDKDWDNYRNKRIGFVFQTYNLISHLSILENVAMSLTLNGIGRKEKLERARKALDDVGLKDLYNKRPNQLSGGQMQRVAIARSLVNNPEIILADEPTGALDSKTSVQIMEILKEISKNKLVIMVTHNQDLADKYSDRIIRFLDGVVESDTWTIEDIENAKKNEELSKKESVRTSASEEKESLIEKKRKEKMSSMSFFTALNISLKNLLTKKGRTIATAVAGSFGIIGVALVLSVNNGFSNYIARTERETASQMPITINAYSINYEEVPVEEQNKEYPTEELVYVYKNNYAKATVQYNNINQKYLNFIDKLKNTTKLVNDYAITYNEYYDMNICTRDPETGEPYSVQYANSSSGINSILSEYSGVDTSFIHTLYGEQEYIEEAYDVIAGKFPDKNNKNEVILLVDSRNQINLKTLKQLGFYKNADTVNQAVAEKNPIKFSDVIGKTYKLFLNSEFYTEHSKQVTVAESGTTHDIYWYEKNDLETLYNDPSKGMELKITGILRPKQNVSFANMSSGLCFQKSLQEYVVKENNKLNMTSKIANNLVWKEGKTVKDFLEAFSSGSLSALFGAENITDMGEAFANTISSSSLNGLFDEYLSYYGFFDGNLINVKTEKDYTFSNYLSMGRKVGCDLVDDYLKSEGSDGVIAYAIKLQSLLNKCESEPEKLDEAYKYFIALGAYLNSYSTIRSLVIFPTGINQKIELMEKLDAYNVIDETGESSDHAANESEQIYYTDLVGSLVDGLGQMINIISVVLIVFASISLVVSSVMTAIITYVSVIERTKEIGILRALGARKKDVGRLFEAECVITGLISGVFGTGIAALITIPINIILNAIYPEYNIGNIADLSWISIIALIAISIVLTFISSLMPSRAAAKKDPVIALRTE